MSLAQIDQLMSRFIDASTTEAAEAALRDLATLDAEHPETADEHEPLGDLYGELADDFFERGEHEQAIRLQRIALDHPCTNPRREIGTWLGYRFVSGDRAAATADLAAERTVTQAEAEALAAANTSGAATGTGDPGTDSNGAASATDGAAADTGAAAMSAAATGTGATEPADTNAGSMEASATEPADTGAASTDPGAADPGAADPGAADPGAADPGAADAHDAELILSGPAGDAFLVGAFAEAVERADAPLALGLHDEALALADTTADEDVLMIVRVPRALLRRDLDLAPDADDIEAFRELESLGQRLSAGTDEEAVQLFLPRGELAAAAAKWPKEMEELGMTDADAFYRELELFWRDWPAAGGAIVLRPLSVALLEEHGSTPGQAADDMPDALVEALEARDDGEPWPPGRNDACWCGSERKYKKCCGAATA